MILCSTNQSLLNPELQRSNVKEMYLITSISEKEVLHYMVLATSRFQLSFVATWTKTRENSQEPNIGSTNTNEIPPDTPEGTYTYRISYFIGFQDGRPETQLFEKAY